MMPSSLNPDKGRDAMVTVAVTPEAPEEPRVAISPETVRKLVALGAKVRIASGSGARSRFSDETYKAQGAEIVPSAAEAVAGLEHGDVVPRGLELERAREPGEARADHDDALAAVAPQPGQSAGGEDQPGRRGQRGLEKRAAVFARDGGVTVG